MEPRFWNNKTHCVKRWYCCGEETDSTINTALATCIRFVNLYFVECEPNFREPVLADLRDKFNYQYKQTDKQKTNEFFLHFEEFIKIQSGEKGRGQDM